MSQLGPDITSKPASASEEIRQAPFSFGAKNSNVQDVLAPLFCNGRSFSNLVDELCRHFRIEPQPNLPPQIAEASSESQSTDSEGNVSDGSRSLGSEMDFAPSLKRGDSDVQSTVPRLGIVGALVDRAGPLAMPIVGDSFTVMAVTANRDGWSEAVGAALATRARAGYVIAQEVAADQPKSSEFVRETFTDERSGAEKALEVRKRLVARRQRVLLCSAWVDSGEYLLAAARLVAQCDAVVFGVACVRFEHNPSTEPLMANYNLFARSMPKGSGPSLNFGMKGCIPASLTKGYAPRSQGRSPNHEALSSQSRHTDSSAARSRRKRRRTEMEGGGMSSPPRAYQRTHHGSRHGDASGSYDGAGDASGSEEWDYAADSERSTDHESMYLQSGRSRDGSGDREGRRRHDRERSKSNGGGGHRDGRGRSRRQHDADDGRCSTRSSSASSQEDTRSYGSRSSRDNSPRSDWGRSSRPVRSTRSRGEPAGALSNGSSEGIVRALAETTQRAARDQESGALRKSAGGPSPKSRGVQRDHDAASDAPSLGSGSSDPASTLESLSDLPPPDTGFIGPMPPVEQEEAAPPRLKLPHPVHHVSMYEANDPGEDRHCVIDRDDLHLHVYCVCDGHGGSRASQYVCESLANDVVVRMAALGAREDRPASDAAIMEALRQAFLECDRKFMEQLEPHKNKFPMSGWQGYINAGCCVILTVLLRCKLYVAHVGDCRAVLGSATKTGSDGQAAPATVSPPPAGSGSSPAQGRGPRSRASALQAIPLSQDHNCDNSQEVALVRQRSKDDKAIRVSRNDEWKGPKAIKRVAGSLAVTRAIGDAYLKDAAYSFTPFKNSVPYITAEPEVNSYDLTPADQFLILATDGVWEQASNQEAVQWVSHHRPSSHTYAARGPLGPSPEPGGPTTPPVYPPRGSRTGALSSDALVNQVLTKAAQAHNMSLTSLKKLPKGSTRRMIHDDICVLVVHLNW